MNYSIEYYKERDTDPMVFLQRFRCTTEPIGGGTEYDKEGELVSWDAAVAAIDIEKKQLIDKACRWLSKHAKEYVCMICDGSATSVTYEDENLIDDFRKAMED